MQNLAQMKGDTVGREAGVPVESEALCAGQGSIALKHNTGGGLAVLLPGQLHTEGVDVHHLEIPHPANHIHVDRDIFDTMLSQIACAMPGCLTPTICSCTKPNAVVYGQLSVARLLHWATESCVEGRWDDSLSLSPCHCKWQSS